MRDAGGGPGDPGRVVRHREAEPKKIDVVFLRHASRVGRE